MGMSSSQLTNSYFSEGLKPPTRYSCFLWPFHETMRLVLDSLIPENEPGMGVLDSMAPSAAMDSLSLFLYCTQPSENLMPHIGLRKMVPRTPSCRMKCLALGYPKVVRMALAMNQKSMGLLNCFGVQN